MVKYTHSSVQDEVIWTVRHAWTALDTPVIGTLFAYIESVIWASTKVATETLRHGLEAKDDV